MLQPMNDLEEIRQWLDSPARPRCDPQTEAYMTYLLYTLNKERERSVLLQSQFNELSQLAQNFAIHIQRGTNERE